MKKTDNDVIIVGAGLAGLSCARHLAAAGIPFVILEAGRRIGGRIKTDRVDDFLLDHGFQVLQTAYPEARRYLDCDQLELKPFAPGAIIRTEDKFHIISDPRRRPQHLWHHLKTYRIAHALPAQPPPMPDPAVPVTAARAGIFVCGEYGSVPGIQWAMLSGRHAAEAVIKELEQ